MHGFLAHGATVKQAYLILLLKRLWVLIASTDWSNTGESLWVLSHSECNSSVASIGEWASGRIE